MENRRGHIRYIYYIYIYTCTGGKWREPIPFLVSWSKLVGRNGRNIRAGQKFGSVPTEMIRRGVNADPLSRPLSLSLSTNGRPEIARRAEMENGDPGTVTGLGVNRVSPGNLSSWRWIEGVFLGFSVWQLLLRISRVGGFFFFFYLRRILNRNNVEK